MYKIRGWVWNDPDVIAIGLVNNLLKRLAICSLDPQPYS